MADGELAGECSADMWRYLAAALVLLGGSWAAPPSPALLQLDDTVSEILSELEDLPVEERLDDSVSPELMELYHDVAVLFEIQKSNISDSREGRGLLSKLSFLTGLKLGSFLTGSGTLAASQSLNFFGKVLNAALSISYGNIGGYPGLEGGLIGGGIEPVGGVGELADAPVTGLQKLPVIQEDVPDEDKKREKPDNAPLVTPSPAASAARVVSAVEKVRKDFLKDHNHRVENFNTNFEKKIRSRTGRIEGSKSDKIS